MISAEYWLQVHEPRHHELAARSDEARRARAVSPTAPHGAPRFAPRGALRALRSVTLGVTTGVGGLRAPHREDPALCC